MKYIFNSTLLRYLSDILGVTQKKLVECYNGDEGTYTYRARHATIRMCDLLDICNTYHIPLSWFIVPEGKEMRESDMPTKEELIVGGKWKDIGSKWQWFGLSYSCYRGKSHKECAKECGISMSNYYNLFVNHENRWKKSLVKDVLKVLNNAKVYPGCVFEDKNVEIEVIDGYYRINIRDKEINIMEEHYLKKSIANGNEMQKEIDSLLAEVERLRESLREKNSEGYLGVVAEEIG